MIKNHKRGLIKRKRKIIVISDTHFGCQFALCPEEVRLDGGGIYRQNIIQKKIWKHWLKFCNEFIPIVTQGEPFILVHNGDIIDGVHHRSTHQISHNLKDQENIAVEVLEPLVNHPKCEKFYVIRGTEAHSGISAECEERIAQRLGAETDINGNYTRYVLWLRFGKHKILANFSHHIGTTSSSAYESTAVFKELIEAYTEAGRYKLEAPDIVVRSHRHKFLMTTIAGFNTNSISLVTPGWQAYTPFTYRNVKGRVGLPEIGGVAILEGSEVPLYIRHFIMPIGRDKEEIV